jgi:glucosamine kinase
LDPGIVLGIDGGGTYTRVAVADLKGNILGFSKKAGSHPNKNQNPEMNVKAAIMEALKLANQSKRSIQYISAGFAGLNNPIDKKWANQYVKLAGLEAPFALVNDAEIAQFGAFLGEPGIIAIAGTGSIVLGKNEKGSILKNFDFHHDSEAAARFLSYSVIYEIISQKTFSEDLVFINSILDYWDVKDIEGLRKIASKGFSNNNIEAVQKLSQMGTLVTNEAPKGNKIACRACEKAVGSLTTGIGLVSSMFSSKTVSLSFVGGVANNPYIKALLRDKLGTKETTKMFIYKNPQLSPVLGAVLYAYSRMGLDVSKKMVDRLLYFDQRYNLY